MVHIKYWEFPGAPYAGKGASLEALGGRLRTRCEGGSGRSTMGRAPHMGLVTDLARCMGFICENGVSRSMMGVLKMKAVMSWTWQFPETGAGCRRYVVKDRPFGERHDEVSPVLAGKRLHVQVQAQEGELRAVPDSSIAPLVRLTTSSPMRGPMFGHVGRATSFC